MVYFNYCIVTKEEAMAIDDEVRATRKRWKMRLIQLAFAATLATRSPQVAQAAENLPNQAPPQTPIFNKCNFNVTINNIFIPQNPNPNENSSGSKEYEEYKGPYYTDSSDGESSKAEKALEYREKESLEERIPLNVAQISAVLKNTPESKIFLDPKARRIDRFSGLDPRSLTYWQFYRTLAEENDL